jgi:hypothetical protein
MTNEYDTYASLMLVFVCNDCKEHIKPAEKFMDCGEEYNSHIARKAESRGWYVGFGEDMVCYCRTCRKKRKL